jgi:DNA-binding Xre family transcriptional regulator
MIKTRFQELVDQQGLSINRISNDTGISRPTLTTMYKDNPTGIQFDTLQTLIRYFEVGISDFLYEDTDAVYFNFKKDDAKPAQLFFSNDDADDASRAAVQFQIEIKYGEHDTAPMKFAIVVAPFFSPAARSLSGMVAAFIPTAETGGTTIKRASELMLKFRESAIITITGRFWKAMFDAMASGKHEDFSIANVQMISYAIAGADKDEPQTVIEFPLLLSQDKDTHKFRLDALEQAPIPLSPDKSLNENLHLVQVNF